MLIGDNFGEGFTTVKFVGDEFEGIVSAEVRTPRTLRLENVPPPGGYEVTVFNDELASETITLTIKAW